MNRTLFFSISYTVVILVQSFEWFKLLLMHLAKDQWQTGDHYASPTSKKVLPGQIFHFSIQKSNIFLFLTRKSIDLSLFIRNSNVFFHFLLLKAPLSCSKRFENFLASDKSEIWLITLAKRSFSLPATARQLHFLWQVQQPGEVA